MAPCGRQVVGGSSAIRSRLLARASSSLIRLSTSSSVNWRAIWPEPTAWAAISPGEREPCEFCCTPQWLDRAPIGLPPRAGDSDDRGALRGECARGLGVRFADLGEHSARRRAVVGTGSASAPRRAGDRGPQRTRDPSPARSRMSRRHASRSGHRHSGIGRGSAQALVAGPEHRVGSEEGRRQQVHVDQTQALARQLL